MIRKIQITAGQVVAEAEFGDTPTARAIFDALPFEAIGDRWGGEIYFEIPVSCELEADSREVLLPGELGYWPEGKCFCIFLGPTPASDGEEIRPASAVNVFGRLQGQWDSLQSVDAGVKIQIEALVSEPSEDTPKTITPQELAQAGQEVTQEEEFQEDQEEIVAEEAPEVSDIGEVEREPEQMQLGIAAADVIEKVPIEEEPEVMDKEYIEPQNEQVEEEYEAIEKESESQQKPQISDSTDDLYTPADEPEEIPLQKPVDLDEQNLSMGMTPETTESAPEPPPAIASNVKIEMTRQTMILLIVVGLVIAALAFILGIMSSGGSDPSLPGKLDSLTNRIDSNETDIAGLKTTTSDLDKTVKNQAASIAAIQKTDRSTQQSVNSLDTQVSQIKKQTGQITALQQQVTALADRQDITWVRNPANGHQYALTPYPLPWHLARDYAEKVGGHLVTINNEAENEWLVVQFGEGVEYWIGLTDELEEGKWVWMTGEPVDYVNWAPGEPDNFLKKQHYVMFNDTKPHRNQVEPGKWNDIVSNEVHIGIIEKEK
ncbi:MAG: hypothetical protein JXA82_07000 [Sedimentisphaerales bacterium]|nr:hypothetical protein [Sedimentisphaerales bacterium]